MMMTVRLPIQGSIRDIVGRSPCNRSTQKYDASEEHPVCSLQPIQECWKDHKHNMPCDCRLSGDALYNLHEIAYDGDFVHRINTFPDFEVFHYSPHILRTFQTLLSRCQCENLPVINGMLTSTLAVGHSACPVWLNTMSALSADN